MSLRQRQTAVAPRLHGAPIKQLVDLQALTTLPGDALALFCWADERPLRGVCGLVDWRLCGALSFALKRCLLVGAVGEALLLPGGARLGQRRIFLFGLGLVDDWSDVGLLTAAQLALQTMHKAGCTTMLLGAPSSYRLPFIEQEFLRLVPTLEAQPGMAPALLVSERLGR